MDKPEVLHIEQHPGVQGLAQIGRNAIDRVIELQQARARDNIAFKQLLAQRDALLEALRKIGRYTGEGPTYTTPWQEIVADLGQTARAAIKAVEGESK